MPVVDERSSVPRLTSEHEHVIHEALSRVEEIRLAYLFGSQASGRVGPLSDIDVAVLVDPKLTERDRHSAVKQAFVKLVRALHTDEIDLVDLGKAPPSLINSIVSKGKIILDRDPSLRIRFVRDSILNYLDTKPLREELSRGLTNRLKEGTFGRR